MTPARTDEGRYPGVVDSVGPGPMVCVTVLGVVAGSTVRTVEEGEEGDEFYVELTLDHGEWSGALPPREGDGVELHTWTERDEAGAAVERMTIAVTREPPTAEDHASLDAAIATLEASIARNT